jgi:hypothetical protein
MKMTPPARGRKAAAKALVCSKLEEGSGGYALVTGCAASDSAAALIVKVG